MKIIFSLKSRIYTIFNFYQIYQNTFSVLSSPVQHDGPRAERQRILDTHTIHESFVIRVLRLRRIRKRTRRVNCETASDGEFEIEDQTAEEPKEKKMRQQSEETEVKENQGNMRTRILVKKV